MYESRLLNIASPAFHYGILFVLAGHLVGLSVPKSWTDSIGVG
jgi:nitrate reductase gamma subunit